jgi:hypothetical protein
MAHCQGGPFIRKAAEGAGKAGHPSASEWHGEYPCFRIWHDASMPEIGGEAGAPGKAAEGAGKDERKNSSILPNAP